MAILFDLETLDNKPTALILDIAVVKFEEKDNDVFSDLVADTSRHFYRKLDVKSQEQRTVSESTIDWWSKQEPEAKKILKKSNEDVSLQDALMDLKNWLEMKRFSLKYDIAYCRGQSFDFPILADAAHRLFDTWSLGYSMFPCAFYNQRDVRTALTYSMLDPKLRKVPVAKGTFDGFVKHNAIHDCCKDIILLQTVLRYANGTQDLPNLEDCDWI